MNLCWNSELRRFEAEFSDFQGDLTAVKAAGFKSDGPPGWVWYSFKATPLQKLRENKPASGLTITPDAKLNFSLLFSVEENNAKVKTQLAEHKKELKKKLKIEEREILAAEMEMSCFDEASGCWIDPPPPPTPNTPVVECSKPPKLKGPKCIVCGDVIAFYERQHPPTCLWCEIKVLDNTTEVC